jgi:hypothetical protein
VAAAIISVLLNSLAMLKTILANSTEESSLVKIKARILGDEQHWTRESGIGATAFFTKASKKTKESKEKEKEKAKKHCTHCNIRGHDVSKCQKLKKEQEGEGTAKAPTSSASTNANPRANAPKDFITALVNIARALPQNQPVVCLFMAITLAPLKDSTAVPTNAPMTLSTIQPVVCLFMALALVEGANIKYNWITDLGASCTMCSN